MAYPSITQTLDTATVATLKDSLFDYDIPQAYRNAVLMQLLLRESREPGLEIQGQNLKLPDVAVKRKTMGGTRATAFTNFQDGVTAEWFSGFDILDTSVADGPTESWTDFSYMTGYVAISGIEKIENTGRGKRLDILRSRQNQEIRRMTRLGETALWSTNTDAVRGTQNAWAGIRHKISTAPTSGNLQGLDRATFTTWRNQYNASGGSFASSGLDTMRSMYYATSGTNSMEPPHLILQTSTISGYMVKALEGIHRVVGALNGTDLSSKTPTYMGIPTAWTDDCPSGYQYWLNFDYMINILHEGAIWSEVIPGEPNDQWIKDQKRYVLGAAPMMLTRPEKQGVVAGYTA